MSEIDKTNSLEYIHDILEREIQDEEKKNAIFDYVNELNDRIKQQAESLYNNSKKWNDIFDHIQSQSSLWEMYSKVSKNPLAERDLIIPFIDCLNKELSLCKLKLNDSKRTLLDTSSTDEDKLHKLESIINS